MAGWSRTEHNIIEYISTYIPGARPGAFGQIRSSMADQPQILVTFGHDFSKWISYASWGPLVQHFGRPEPPKRVNLERLLVPSGGPGLHVRTALPLQRELDLAGSGGSRNRLFSGLLFRHAKKATLSMSFIDF